MKARKGRDPARWLKDEAREAVEPIARNMQRAIGELHRPHGPRKARKTPDRYDRSSYDGITMPPVAPREISA